MSVRILTGDCRDVLPTLEAESVHCAITSPPYYGLRDYGTGAWRGGDPACSHSQGKGTNVKQTKHPNGSAYPAGAAHRGGNPNECERCGAVRKDLMMMPARLALALQADGWYLRSDIIWAKPNPMPESVTDRPTSAHEHVFLLSKSARYFYDAEAVREPDGNTDHPRNILHKPEPSGGVLPAHNGIRKADGRNGTGRNLRNVWTIATAPYAQAHFATFPPKLVEPCIKAGTSEKGCCAACGAPWVREVEKTFHQSGLERDNITGQDNMQGWEGIPRGSTAAKTLGWSPSCQCNAAVVPCTVLDPFGGAGTTGLVADRLGRNAILIELNPEYASMAEQRLHDDAGMFGEVAAQ